MIFFVDYISLLLSIKASCLSHVFTMLPLLLSNNFKNNFIFFNCIPIRVFTPDGNSSQSPKVDVDCVIVDLVQAEV